MIDYRPEHFEHALGACFAIVGAPADAALTLDAIVPLPVSQRPGGGFALEFSGPVTAMVAQGLFALEQDGARHDIFLVAVASDGAVVRYEAVFN